MANNYPKTKLIFQLLITLCCQRMVLLTEFTHDRKRLGQMNLVMAEHSCLQKFSVSENTIIRTQDSRALGAKFLNVSDVSKREDCLSLCCSTRFCDVAVFQEKGPFPCYLFDCGPPEDFVCKFSTHSYYTSAVLTINRHQLDLGLWSSQHKHETELSDLRSAAEDMVKPIITSDEKIPKIVQQHSQVTTKFESLTTRPTTPRVTTPKTIAEKSQPVGRKCSRFQFECHSGECIAIYNACDGIPQCQDGSDEAHDLSCPQDIDDDRGANEETDVNSKGTLESSWKNQATARRKYDQDRSIFNHRASVLEYENNRGYGNGAASPDYPREDSLGYGGNGKGPGLYDYNQQRHSSPNRYNGGKQDGSSQSYHHEYPDYSLVNAPRDRQPQLQPSSLLRPISQLQNVIPQDKNKVDSHYSQRQDLIQNPMWQQNPNSRYTSYPGEQKQSSMRSDQMMMGSDQMMTGGSMNDQLYNQSPGRTSTNLRLPSNSFHQDGQRRPISNTNPSIQNQNNLQLHSQQQHSISNKNHAANSGPVLQNAVIPNNLHQTEQSQSKNLLDSKIKEKPPIDNDSNGSKNGNSSASKSNSGLEKVPKKETAESSQAGVTDGTASDIMISRLEVDVRELEREEETQKAQTSGALLALSLGICITSILAVLLGCRIKGIRRKAHRQRGMKSPLEHDADYLVNGMYL